MDGQKKDAKDEGGEIIDREVKVVVQALTRQTKMLIRSSTLQETKNSYKLQLS